MDFRVLARATTHQAIALALFGVLATGVTTAARADVIVTPVGSPLFVAADFHLFAAPIGTAGSGYAEFFETQQLILPPPNHAPNPTLGIGPGAAHAGPYDHEMADGVAANGYVEGTTFTTEQYSNGSGVYFVFTLLPSTGSPAGSSPDFASGPILASAMFPLTISGVTFTNGSFNDTLGGICGARHQSGARVRRIGRVQPHPVLLRRQLRFRESASHGRLRVPPFNS